MSFLHKVSFLGREVAHYDILSDKHTGRKQTLKYLDALLQMEKASRDGGRGWEEVKRIKMHYVHVPTSLMNVIIQYCKHVLIKTLKIFE